MFLDRLRAVLVLTLIAWLAWPNCDARAAAVSYTWKGTSSSQLWATTSNWSPSGVPDYDDNVTFGTLATVNTSIDLAGTSREVTNVVFSNTKSTTIRNSTGSAALTISASITCNGTHSITAPVELGGWGGLSIGGTGTLSLSNATILDLLSIQSGANVSAANITGLAASGGTAIEMDVDGTLTTTTGSINVNAISLGGGTGTSQTTLTVGNGSTVTATGTVLAIGYAGKKAVVNVGTGATLKATGAEVLVGYASTTSLPGMLTQTGGLVDFSQASYVSVGTYGAGTYSQTGGAAKFPTSVNLLIGDSETAAGAYNLSGTSSTVEAGAIYLGYQDTATGTFKQDNGTVTAGSLIFGLATYGTATKGAYGLNGGTLNVNNIRGNSIGTGASTLEFNGGTLKARQSTAQFLQGLTDAKVLSGGAIIDTGAYNVTIAQSLKHGGALTTDGGLEKKGTGTLTLTGANSYKGATKVNQGTLVVGKAGALPAGGSLSIGSGGVLVLGGGTALVSAATADPVVVPEPGSMIMLTVGLLVAGLLCSCRRR